MKINRKIKRMFSIYNVAIFTCIIIIIVALIIIFKPSFATKKYTADGVELIQSKVKENEEISEADAKKMAIKQFEKLGEKDLKEEDLKSTRIRRKEDEYYYIKSRKNNMEIKIIGGITTRLNNVLIEQ